MSYRHLPRQLEERITQLEDEVNQGEDFDAVAWLWLVGMGVILPIIAILWGYNA